MSTSKIILVISFLAVICIHADRITRVEVRTAECDDCGMSNTFGALRMQVFSYDIHSKSEILESFLTNLIIESFMNFHKVCNSLVECCNTGKLDNSFHDDFRGKLIDRWKNCISHFCHE